MITDHDCAFRCKTETVQKNKTETIKVGIARCLVCEYEVDCPIKEHVHG